MTILSLFGIGLRNYFVVLFLNYNYDVVFKWIEIFSLVKKTENILVAFDSFFPL